MKSIATICFCLSLCLNLSAQDYNHYYIHFNVGGTQYSGVMALNTRLPKQVLRLAYYQP